MGGAANFDWLMRVGVLFGTDGFFFIIKSQINMKVWVSGNTREKGIHIYSFFWWFGQKKYTIFFWTKNKKKRIEVMIIFFIWDQKNIVYFFGPNHQKKRINVNTCFHLSEPSY